MDQALNKIIEEFFFEEKILICPSRGVGTQIMAGFQEAKGGWLHIRASTVQCLAEAMVEEQIYRRKLRQISAREVFYLIDTIFTALSDKGSFQYFQKHTLNSGMIRALSQAILELKYACIPPLGLNTVQFIHPRKADDLILLYRQYNAMLEEKALVDGPDIIGMAMEDPGFGQDSIYIVFSRHDYTPLEQRFLRKLGKEKLLIIGDAPVYGAVQPQGRLEANFFANEASASQFSWLLDIDHVPEHCSRPADIEIFAGQSHYHEIYGILSRIAQDNITADQTEIIYTARDPYLQTIYNVCAKLDIPAVFFEGIPGDLCPPGIALKGFLLWILQDFLEVHLRKLLKHQLILVPDKGVTGSMLAYALRTSKIGWGRERYRRIPEKRIAELQEKMHTTPKQDNHGFHKIKIYKSLQTLCTSLLALVPDIEDGCIAFGKLCKGCMAFLDNFIKPGSEEGGHYVSALKEKLTTLAIISNESMPLPEAVHKIIALLTDTPYGPSGPKPGCLFVSSMGSGGVSNRNNTFVVGMDGRNFPGTEMQNPVLLDGEKSEISGRLHLSGHRLKQKLYDFVLLLTGLKGKVIFSYAAYDIKDDRRMYPSTLLLQALRLKKADSSLTYQDLYAHVGQPSGFGDGMQQDIFLDENGWWLDKLTGQDSLKEGTQSVCNLYPWLSKGQKAADSRTSSTLTVYDGLVHPRGDELDPRKNADFILSCSSIESYAYCPFAFFLEYVLRVRRPEETERDYARWLAPKDRGSLLHEVFHSYAEKVKKTGRPDRKKQVQLIYNILDQAVARYAEEVPVAGEAVFAHEIEDLRRDLQVFLDIDNKYLHTPYLLEYEFGYRGKQPVKVGIGYGQYIHIAGKVDRVDVSGQGYQVWDYKGGSAFAYHADAYIDRGRQVQHILYAKVVEQVIKKEDPGAKVTACGYILPTERGRASGKGCVFRRDPCADHQWQQALHCLFDLMASGVFIRSEEANPPYLDDEDIYGTEQEKVFIKVKVEHSEKLENWKRLKEFK